MVREEIDFYNSYFQSYFLSSAFSLKLFMYSKTDSVRITLKATSTVRSAPFSFMITLASKPGHSFILWFWRKWAFWGLKFFYPIFSNFKLFMIELKKIFKKLRWSLSVCYMSYTHSIKILYLAPSFSVSKIFKFVTFLML